MTWDEICVVFPEQWVLVEALDAVADREHGKHIIRHIALIAAYSDDPCAVWLAC